MTDNKAIDNFLAQYSEDVFSNAQKLREIILKNLPEVQEQIDLPAKMIAYSYGQKYSEMICTLIPSPKALKLGFYKGMDLPDPENVLTGKGKISRYIEIKQQEDIKVRPLTALLKEAFKAYKIRNL
ncbi:MAG: DUF1801 domain-containing protein [Chitinophagaceae bacterium]|nr:DUF1801 domain-containing protein [Chitinophagaceae bacterium]